MKATQQWQWLEDAPAAALPGPPGALATARGEPLHGVWRTSHGTDAAVVVLANHGHPVTGWLVPRHDWRAPGPLLSVGNAAVAHPWAWDDAARGRAVVSEPPDTAIALVLAGRKPAARAETLELARAQRWVQAAHREGLAVRHEQVRVECPPSSSPLQVVTVARRESFEVLVDLAVIHDDLLSACRSRPGVAFELALLAVTPVAELLEDDCDDEHGCTRLETAMWTCGTGAAVRSGLALGHHPALIAGRVLGLPSLERQESARAFRARVHAIAREEVAVPLPGLPRFGRQRGGARATRMWGGVA